MALTKVSDSLLDQPLDLSVKGINSSGIVTATSFTGGGDNLTFSKVSASSSITANKFYGDGSQLTGVSGFGNAVSTDPLTGGTEIFKVPDTLTIGAATSMTVQSDSASGWQMFTRARDIHVGAGATLHIASNTSNGSVGSGTTFKTNIMGLSQGVF